MPKQIHYTRLKDSDDDYEYPQGIAFIMVMRNSPMREALASISGSVVHP